MIEKKEKKIKWEWKLTNIIDPRLDENQIKEEVNRKLAYIIIELEHNPINYIKTRKDD